MSKEFGHKIYQLRSAAGFTQQQIADEINVDRSTYSNYERAITEPDLKTLKKLADIFRVDVNTLLSDNEDFSRVADKAGEPSYNLAKDEKTFLIRYRLLNSEQKKACFDFMGEFLIVDEK
ncbi:MAG: helix-turn-helix domain-containing protein [Clostridia bacterium]|nr:helix-turn-helix domain-containing protein [Clostridia bacterium]